MTEAWTIFILYLQKINYIYIIFTEAGIIYNYVIFREAGIICCIYRNRSYMLYLQKQELYLCHSVPKDIFASFLWKKIKIHSLIYSSKYEPSHSMRFFQRTFSNLVKPLLFYSGKDYAPPFLVIFSTECFVLQMFI